MFRSRPSKAPELRYYLYISDAKLDMLFEQIDRSVLKRITAEVKVDLKLASVTLRGADNPGPTRAAKLRVVERFIEAHHRVGTIEEPGHEYFRGQLRMWWGWVDGAVWFQNFKSEGDHCVVLVGSRHHVIGESSASIVPNSGLPSITDVLRKANLMDVSQIGQAVGKEELPRSWLENVLIMWDWGDWPSINRPPSQRVEFLAIPLVETQLPSSEEGTHVILATPLYVALAR